MTIEKGAHEVTTREARNLVGVGPITFSAWVKRAKIQPHRVVPRGDAIPTKLWLKGDIERLIHERKTKGGRSIAVSLSARDRILAAFESEPVKRAIEARVNDLVEKRIAQIFGRQPELVG